MIRPTQEPSPLNILVVEDSLMNQRLISGLLRSLPCEVTCVSDGKAAVARALAEDFDVIFMDIQMPIMDGLTATRIIRRLELRANRYTPIIAVTAGIDRRTCLEAGMDEYIAKPVRKDLLHLTMERVLDSVPSSSLPSIRLSHASRD